MGDQSLQERSAATWTLIRQQHGVIARRQLLELGFSARAVKHRLTNGRLHRVWRGVYAVGRPYLTQHGLWMAAVLRCGPKAVLSHHSAAALWGIRPSKERSIEVSVPADVARVPSNIVVHRRVSLEGDDLTRCQGIPVTSPTLTLVDLATCLDEDQLARSISEADRMDLTDPEELRARLDHMPFRRGAPALRTTMDRPTFSITDSELERRFIPIAKRAGLPRPSTREYLNGWRVDFYWPDLGLVVETDGLRYHRTPFQQERDRLRDQAHVAAGLTPLRFTRAQVVHQPAHVEGTLAAVANRLRAVQAAGS